jgi:hypothetical protein
VHRREELVAITQVVLAYLGRQVTLGFDQFGQRRVLRLQSQRSPRQTHRRQAGAQRELPGNERRPTSGAARLGVAVGQCRTLGADAVDVGSRASHDSAVICLDVEPSDVVSNDQEHVRFS